MWAKVQWCLRDAMYCSRKSILKPEIDVKLTLIVWNSNGTYKIKSRQCFAVVSTSMDDISLKTVPLSNWGRDWDCSCCMIEKSLQHRLQSCLSVLSFPFAQEVPDAALIEHCSGPPSGSSSRFIFCSAAAAAADSSCFHKQRRLNLFPLQLARKS